LISHVHTIIPVSKIDTASLADRKALRASSQPKVRAQQSAHEWEAYNPSSFQIAGRTESQAEQGDDRREIVFKQNRV